MKNKIGFSICLGLAGILMLAGFIFISKTSLAQDKNVSKSKYDFSSLPIVDLQNDKLQPNEARLKRSSKFDIKEQAVDVEAFVIKEDSRSLIFAYPNSHAPIEPAFPVSNSDIIVLGQVLSAQAYLSNDKTNIYSEFEVLIDKTLKGENQTPAGNKVIVERAGGRIRFPSGNIITRPNILGRNLPNVGGKYIFFLKSNSDNDDSFSIITGYSLNSAKVMPLDFTPDGEEKFKSFSEYENYKNSDQNKFWVDLNNAIKKNSTSIKVGGE